MVPSRETDGVKVWEGEGTSVFNISSCTVQHFNLCIHITLIKEQV